MQAIWSLIVALAIVPVAWVARGTPLGEPFADDFDFLHHTLFTGRWHLFDGGGGGLYWRPLARQVYYGVFEPVLLSHPFLIAFLHMGAFALAAVLIQRALARTWPAPVAALAAVFPLALPGVRVMIAWPSCAQDLGVFLGMAAALYALARGRTRWALAATAAALLCKEIAVPLALSLPLLPVTWAGGGRGRVRFAAQLGVLLLVYAAAHEAVRVFAHQLPLTAVAPSAEGAAWDWPARIAWALRRALLDAFDSPETGDMHRTLWWGIVACLAAAIATVFVSRERREQTVRLLPWMFWGVLFWVLGSAPLAPYAPDWATYRSVVPAIGLGIASAALLGAAWPSVLVTFAAVHLAGVLWAPGAPPLIEAQWQDNGSAFDFTRLTQIQRFVYGTRLALAAQAPKLAPGAVIVRHAWPRTTDYAFEHGKAFEVWYRDTTIRAISFASLQHDPAQRIDAIVEFQPLHVPQLTLIEPARMRSLLGAVADLHAGRLAPALAVLQMLAATRDTDDVLFLATVNSKIAAGLAARGGPGDDVAAEAAAERAYRWYADDQDARVLLAQAAIRRGDKPRARELLDAHLARFPDDVQAKQMRSRLHE